MKNRLLPFLVFFFAFFFVAATIFAAPTVITVSPGGPISSLQKAVEEVRKLEKAQTPIVVEFQAGEYPMTEPVVFTAADSGTEKAPITYRAAKDQNVVLTGGRKITGWKKGENGIWTTKIDGYFEQLYVGGRWATRCRTPNADAAVPYFYTEEKVDTALDPATGKPAPMAHRAFVATAKDIVPLKSVPKDRLGDVMFKMYHSWESSAHRLASLDFDARQVIFTGPARWPLMRWEPRQRYHIENYREALDQPGEWFLDRDGTLSYIPRPGEDMTTIETVAPVAAALLRFDGSIEKDTKDGLISNISFENLKFRHVGYTLEPQGHSDGQSAITVPFAVQLDGCRKISFENCEFSQIACNAVRFFRGCTDCRFVKNYVHDLGCGGVYIGMAWEPGHDKAALTERNTVENCIIRDGGRFDHGAIGVWIGHGSYNKVLHNDISEFYYTGVSVGWQWGYQPSRSNHNTIEFNHIHHLGHWIMSDMGGVYTLGVSPGTTVSNNVMHDIYAYSYGGWGLYTDEGSTDIVMENNLVYRVKTGTFHQHYGKENIVRNNILAYSLTDQIQRSRIEEHISFFLENNIIVWEKDAVLFGHPWSRDTLSRWGDEKVVIKSNLYWNADADMSKAFPSKDGSGNDLKTWQEISKHDAGSIVADPKFKDPKNGDFTLPDDSPAFKVGFKRFDYSKAGVYGDEKWIALAKNFDHPVRPVAPEKLKPMPLRVNDGFETPRSVPILKCQINDEGKKGLVRISTDRPASGEKCLEVRDSSEMKHSFNPHLVFSPGYDKGVSRIAFSLRVQKNADAHVEWRDKSQPYRIGPSLRVQNGKLTFKDTPPIEFPLDQWVRFEVTAKLGEAADGSWDMVLTFADGTKKEWKSLKPVHADWRTLDWFGFCNLGKSDENCSFFLDDLVIVNE